MAKVGVGLSSPWCTFYKEIKALFEQDPDIKIEYDNDTPEVKLFVEDAEKADALTQLLPVEKVFGNVILKITVVPADKAVNASLDLYEKAFKDNPALSYTAKVETPFSRPVNFVVFQNKVVQFFNDDLTDINGNCSTLYQEIARDVFGTNVDICYCTDVPESEGKPLGNWLG